MATRRSTASTIALLLLRLVTGGLLLVRGLQHLLVTSPEALAAGIAVQDLPAPTLLAWLLVLGEIGLGVLLVVGLLTRPAAALAALMVALVWVSQYVVTLPGAGALVAGAGGVPGESALVLAVVALALSLLGPGAASVDQVRGRRGRATR